MVLSAIEQLDVALLHFVQSFASPFLDVFFLIMTFFGSPIPWFVLGAIVYWSGRENKGFHFMNILLFSIIVIGSLKAIIARPRPSPEFFRVIVNDHYSTFSFPSSHAGIIASYYSYLRGRLAKNIARLFALLVLLVMLSRTYLGVHFPSDVIVGAIIGIGIGLIAWFFETELIQHHFKLSKLEGEFFFVMAIMLALASLFFLGEITILGAMFGFYAGFFLSKETGLKAKSVYGRKALEKQLMGLSGLAVIVIPSLFVKSIEPQFVFIPMFFAGFWVSFAFPWVYENILNKG